MMRSASLKVIFVFCVICGPQGSLSQGACIGDCSDTSTLLQSKTSVKQQLRLEAMSKEELINIKVLGELGSMAAAAGGGEKAIIQTSDSTGITANVDQDAPVLVPGEAPAVLKTGMKNLDFLGAVFSNKSRLEHAWFRDGLREKGAVILEISIDEWRGVPGKPCDSHGHDDCANHKQFLEMQVFRKCSSCKFFYFDKDVHYTWDAALSMETRSGSFIKGGTSKTVSCTNKRYDKLLSLEQVRRAKLIIIDSPRTVHTCPSELKDKMLNLAEYYTGEAVPSAEVLHKRRASMQEKWDVYSNHATNKSERFIVCTGRSTRDFSTVIKAAQGLGVQLRIFSGGKKVMGCDASTQCRTMPFVSRAEYDEAVSQSLFVAVPLTKFGKSSAGLTATLEGLFYGKIVVMTDKGAHLADEYIKHDQTGFLVKAGDVAEWRRIIDHLTKAPADLLRKYEEAVFDLAQSFSRESTLQRLITRVAALQ